MKMIDLITASGLGEPAGRGRLAMRRRREMGRHPAPTFVFVDLAGYTALTERRGDDEGARVALAFQRAIGELSRRHGAWQVKSLGDGAMIWAPDARRAVQLAAEALAGVGRRADLLPVRIGVHTGPAVMSGADWYGSTVNVAARLAARAEPNQALISAASRTAAGRGVPLPLGRCRQFWLRGVDRPVLAWCLTG
jgi:adenylate cyclase